ncbi:MAG TPA: DUF6600 domain-containing protein [Pyrinomonadaceae bacterium]|nr:DUF6600 domain-containing protein [Pyrinomonadaceae bacterium]
MRRAKSLFAASLFIMLLLLSASLSVVRADDEDADTDEYDVTARVVRTSLLEGQVELRRAGNKAWEQARLNLPLVEGDTLATGRDARVELQLDAHNFVRLDANSLLRIVTLRSEGIVLSLVEGTATIRLARFDRKREYFEIDMPKTTMSVEQTGLYRLDVARDGGLRLIARDGGRARVYADADGFTLRDERSATLTYAGGTEGDWQFSAASSFDTWDTWVNDRERYLAARLRYEQRDRYYDADIWGAEELDAYGEWVYADNYGWVWRPHTTVTNNYHDWAPYRHGHWRWCPPYGWTWVGDEPWGWAPYHYGRWVYYNQGWCWAPRGYSFRYGRNWWRPALVAFVYVPSSYGEHVAWYPLTYGQHDPHRRNHRPRSRPGRLTPLRGRELDNLRRINPAMARAVTTVPVREFGTEGARLRPAAAAIARNAMNSEPVRLPVRTSDQTGAAARDTRSGRLPAARPAPIVPAAAQLERPTGAAERSPSVPLDDELWRTRVYQGRQPRPARPPAVGAGTDPADRDTGAVTRPALPATRPPLNAGDTDDVDRNYRNNLPSGVRPTLPTRPSQPPRARDEDRPPVSPDENVTPAPVDERPPARPPRTAEPPTSPGEATTPPAESPEIFNPTPARPDRPAPAERDMPVARPTSPETRPAPPETRPAPPERREEPAPPQVSQPEPSRPEPARPEPPPPPREEPPPPPAEPAQREETPSPPPPAPDPPPSAPDPPREAPSPPPDRTPEEDRARPPLG